MKKEFLYQSKKIIYFIFGSGRPVLLIHGFGETDEVWKTQIEFLKDKFQLIVPQLPGTGKSEMIPDMSIEGMAEVMHAIIHEEKIETAFIIGHSMGGYITLALAEKYYNHVNAFGLIHSTAFADSDEKKETRKKGIEFISRHGAFEFLKNSIPNLFSQAFKETNPDFVPGFIRSLSSFSDTALIEYYQAMLQRPDRTIVLKNCQMPVLIIAGKYDVAIPLKDILAQCHLGEKVYFHTLKQSGHMGMLEEPTTTSCILEKFLEEN